MIQRQAQVQGARHGQVKRRQAAGAAQIELIEPVVRKAAAAQLPHAEPFQIQHQHAALGQVDAPQLLVLDGFPLGCVPVDVHGQRHAACERLGHVQQARDPQAAKRLVAKLADRIAWPAGDGVEPFDARRPAPIRWRAAKDDLFEHVAPQPGSGLLPLGAVLVFGEPDDAGLDECPHLFHRFAGRQNRGAKRRCNGRLGARDEGACSRRARQRRQESQNCAAPRDSHG